MNNFESFRNYILACDAFAIHSYGVSFEPATDTTAAISPAVDPDYSHIRQAFEAGRDPADFVHETARLAGLGNDSDMNVRCLAVMQYARNRPGWRVGGPGLAIYEIANMPQVSLFLRPQYDTPSTDEPRSYIVEKETLDGYRAVIAEGPRIDETVQRAFNAIGLPQP